MMLAPRARGESVCLCAQDREWYARRKDKLHMKRRYYEGASLAHSVESYSPGSAYGIHELHHYYSVNEAGESVVARRVGHYYCSARLEGLAFKDEQVGVKTVERYEGRADRLKYRSVTYGRAAAADALVLAPALLCLDLAHGNPCVMACSKTAIKHVTLKLSI
jgi:hypothetical protein